MKKYLIKDIISGSFVKLVGDDAQPVLVNKPTIPSEFNHLAHFNTIENAEKKILEILENRKSIALTIIEVYI